MNMEIIANEAFVNKIQVVKFLQLNPWKGCRLPAAVFVSGSFGVSYPVHFW